MRARLVAILLMLLAGPLVAGCFGPPREAYCRSEARLDMQFVGHLDEALLVDAFEEEGWSIELGDEPGRKALTGHRVWNGTVNLTANVGWSRGGPTPEAVENLTLVSIVARAAGPESRVAPMNVTAMVASLDARVLALGGTPQMRHSTAPRVECVHGD